MAARPSAKILQVGYGLLTQSLLALHRKRDIALTILEPDRRRFDSAQGFLARHGNILLVNADKIAQLGQFDLVIAVENLHRLPGAIGLVGMRQWLAPRGVLLALEPAPSLFQHILSGFEPARQQPRIRTVSARDSIGLTNGHERWNEPDLSMRKRSW